MKTDSLFYRLFQTLPSLLFELTEIPLNKSEQYQFKSVEIKQTSFRLDGIFSPPEDNPTLPIIFVEVQFQSESDFYSRFFAEIFLYLRQYKPINPWRGVVVYPNRRVDISETEDYEELLNSLRVRRIYLNETLEKRPQSLSLRLVQLIITPADTAINTAKSLVQQTRREINDTKQLQQLFDLIETIIVYKLPRLSREEIQQMLEFTEIQLKQTRFYQDVFAEGKQEGKQEGRQEGEVTLILRQLNRRLGQLELPMIEKIQRLTVPQLEELAEALLDFFSLTDLDNWLQRY